MQRLGVRRGCENRRVPKLSPNAGQRQHRRWSRSQSSNQMLSNAQTILILALTQALIDVSMQMRQHLMPRHHHFSGAQELTRLLCVLWMATLVEGL